MNDEVRGAIIATMAAVLGWMTITSINLLTQVSSLNTITDRNRADIDKYSANLSRIEAKLQEEIEELREILGHGRR